MARTQEGHQGSMLGCPHPQNEWPDLVNGLLVHVLAVDEQPAPGMNSGPEQSPLHRAPDPALGQPRDLLRGLSGMVVWLVECLVILPALQVLQEPSACRQ
eukprot:1219151-Rhodomonas_salina.2